MNKLNLEIKNPEPILKTFKALFEDIKQSEDVYLRVPGQQDYDNPLNLEQHTNVLGMRQMLLPEVLHIFGIRSMTLNSHYDLMALHDLSTLLFTEQKIAISEYLKNNALVEELKRLFSKCRTIAFDDWGSFGGSSEIWKDLLKFVILPLEIKKIEFIFYLGNPLDRPSFQIGEVLDIISEFANVGGVTLALDESEALSLWRFLNGVDPAASLGTSTIVDLKKKYYSIFLAIAFARLLIYSTDSAILLSSKEQFVLSRKSVDARVEVGDNARQNFISGYSAGLHIDASTAESIALGLIIFGASANYDKIADIETVHQYIDNWVADLERPESMNLYQ